jgi:outer membrane cobalamin receptor
MRFLFAAVAMLAVPALAAAQQPDSAMHQHGDTLTRTPVQLQEITVTTQHARREEPSSATRVTAATIRQTPAPNTYQLLRETAGIEVHDQGQGPGFASDASVRGFSSDHSTDLALWIDGVPINEPVNGHAEGYNDWYVLFPEAVSDIDVLKGPVSALYGNFAMAGVVNVRTLERMTGSDARLSAGSWGRIGGSMMTGWNHDHSSGVFGVRGLREDGWRRNSGYWLGQGHARYVRDLSDRVSLDAGAEL